MVSAVSKVIVFGVQRIGRYEVLNHLASGGMGQVYLARATGLGGFERQVVVKTLDLSIAGDEDDAAFVNMFLDEARLVGALNHQYIAPVYEVGCDEEGRYYLVMDFVQGETAEAVFRVSSERNQLVPLAFSLTVGSCVASALDYAHRLCAADGSPLNVVHRDVSLSNVMCSHDGAVKLIDFGIAKAANRATKTQVGTLKGKIGYLAPEQIMRGPVDHRADIFALGIVLYELTTGTRAFRDNSDLVTLERITTGDIRRPSEVVAGYPHELERIVMKALSVDPAKRFQDAGALGRSLEAYAAATAIPLGHAPIADAMGKLFSDRRGRRRLARGSSEGKSDPALAALPIEPPAEDEPTPITDLADIGTVTLEGETLTRNVPLARSQRPTIPMLDRKRDARPRLKGIPLEDRPTPIADAALAMRVRNAIIPLEDRPTPIAEPLPLPLAPPQRPTPPQRPSLAPRSLHMGTGLKIPTGPQLPIEMDDVPTEIAATTRDHEDPTDVTGEQPIVQPLFERPRTGTGLIAWPPRGPDPAIRTWLLLCGLFLLAVIVAIIVGLL